MKKGFVFIVLLLTTSLLLVCLACSPPGSGIGGGETGTVTISFGNTKPSATRSTVPWPPDNPDNYILDKIDFDIKFTRSGETIKTLAANGSDNIKTSLPSGHYSVHVTAYYRNALYARGSNTVEVKARQNNSVTITMRQAEEDLPSNGILLSQTGTHIFSSVLSDYPPVTPLAITVTNTGDRETGELTVALSDTTGFTLSSDNIASIPVSGSTIDVFTVGPKPDLTGGTYSATVTVSGANGITASFGVSFTVLQTYTVSFNINEGSGTTPSSITQAGGTQITLPDGNDFSRPNHTFGGWNTLANGTGTNYAAGTVYTITTNITLYAVWIVNSTFIITFTQISDAAPEISGPTISRTGTGYPTTETLTVSGDPYDSIEWFIDNAVGAGTTGSGPTFTLDATNPAYNAVGAHSLTLEVVAGGIPYNKTVTFTVVQ
jgi:hypothetical protein